MLDDSQRPGHGGEQPYLHDLTVLVAAPMQAWSARDGSITPGAGAQGIYLGDTRIVRGLAISIDGWSVAHLGADGSRSRRLRWRSVVRRGGGVIDPEVVLVRERSIAGDRVTEELVLTNDSDRPVAVALRLHLTPDASPMEVVKSGAMDAVPARVADSGWSDEAARVIVRLTADGELVRHGQAYTVTWRLIAPSGGSATGRWSLCATDAGAVVATPAVRGVAGAEERIAIPRERSIDLGHLLHRAFDDLDGLQLTLPGLPGTQFTAAGAPWFLTLFGRDSIITASLLLPVVPHVALGTLRALALLQGTADRSDTAEAPGRIVHELRREPASGVGPVRHPVLPPRYYGTVDATPLWISLLHDAWRAGMRLDDVATLAPNLEAAIGWLLRAVDAHPRGFLAYHDPARRGLANQGWKDSGDAIRWADGSMAVAPIALCEVQGYAARAARHAAALLDALGRDGAADLRSWADAISERFRAAFWVTDPVSGSPYPAIALDAEGRAVDGMTSNIGHLLGTGILDPAERRAVVDRLMDPAMFSGFGIRTLSTTNGGYGPLRYHAGAVWPHDTALIIAGMLADGFTDEARTLAEGLLAAAASFDWQLPELFAGVAREESTRAIPYPAACHPQAWSAAAAVVVARALGASITPPVGAPADAGSG